VPGPPVQFGPPVKPETVQAAEGFTGIGLRENDIFYFHPDHLGSTSYISTRNGSISQHVEYIAFGEVLFEEHSSSFSSPYLFNGKELDRETNLSYYGARYLDMKTSLWLTVDPLAEKMPNYGSYVFAFNNPVKFVDPDGMRPIPLYDKFKKWSWRIDSGFGARNTGLPGASKFHRGLDFNYVGGGDTDYGSSILTTHDGIATVDNDPSGGEGRMVIITSADKKFRTRYFHLSKVTIKDGQEVSESDIIGEMGGSANGKEKGRQVHLHYEIQKINPESGKYESIDPTEGNGKDGNKVIDPQKWINKTTDEKVKFDWNFGGKSKVEFDVNFKIPKMEIRKIEIQKTEDK
jgi:RHS repeat-associated protein